MKNFEFKGNRYNLVKLILHHHDTSLVDFNQGVVTDLSNQEKIEIQDLFFLFESKIEELLKNSRNFSSSQEQLRIKQIYEKQIKDIKIAEYKSKLESDEITLDEIENWIALMNYKDRNAFGIVKYSNFITINHAKPKPENLSYSDYGKFFKLIYLMSYDNNIKYNNGKPIKRQDLAENLGFTNVRSFDNYINKLKKENMILKTEPNHNDVTFLMINPAYAMRQIRLNLTIYNYFKEDLDDLLTPLEKKYIELKGASNDETPMVAISDK